MSIDYRQTSNANVCKKKFAKANEQRPLTTATKQRQLSDIVGITQLESSRR